MLSLLSRCAPAFRRSKATGSEKFPFTAAVCKGVSLSSFLALTEKPQERRNSTTSGLGNKLMLSSSRKEFEWTEEVLDTARCRILSPF